MKRVLLALLCGACGTVDVVIADLPDGGVQPTGRMKPCLTTSDGGSTDCADGEYCEKRACGESMGRCVRLPVACDNTLAAVCGCNGVTYWNDCLRKASGVAASSVGECVAEGECFNRNACADAAAVCGRLNSCNGPGTCWVLPSTCPATTASQWLPCGPPGPPPPPPCRGLCDALRTELPQRPAMGGMCL